jgi:hypothetical protein
LAKETDIDYNTFNPNEYSVINGILTDISDTNEYKAKIALAAKNAAAQDLTARIREFELKQIRSFKAIANNLSTQDDIDKYNGYETQIADLRTQITELTQG